MKRREFYKTIDDLLDYRVNDKELIKKTEKLNQLIRKNDVGFEEAQAYLETKPLFWLIVANHLPSDVCLTIWSFAFDFPAKKMPLVFNLANERIHDRAIEACSRFSLFKSQRTMELSRKGVDDRYQRRIIF